MTGPFHTRQSKLRGGWDEPPTRADFWLYVMAFAFGLLVGAGL